MKLSSMDYMLVMHVGISSAEHVDISPAERLAECQDTLTNAVRAGSFGSA